MLICHGLKRSMNTIEIRLAKKENTRSIQLLEKIGFTFNDILVKDKELLNLYLLQKENLIH